MTKEQVIEKAMTLRKSGVTTRETYLEAVPMVFTLRLPSMKSSAL